MSYELAATIHLLRHRLVSWDGAAERIADAGGARQLLARVLEPKGQLFTEGTEAPDLAPILDEIRSWRTEGIDVIPSLDERYPSTLRSVHDRPAMLLLRGRLDPADERSVAVVGARRSTPEGRERAGAVVRDLVANGYVIVSGLATGIDTAAHRAALDVGGRTIAVVGTGLRRSYPPENKELQEQLSETSAVISQFWPDQPPAKYTFPKRNAVMSGMALATVVVEASETSGARIQARVALQHGRPVFLANSVLAQTWAKEAAERPGVYVIERASEVAPRLARIYADTENLVLS